MSETGAVTKKNRLDYQIPDYRTRRVYLEFDIRDGETFVTSVLDVVPTSIHNRPLVLEGRKLKTLEVSVNGQVLDAGSEYQIADETLTLNIGPGATTVKTRVRLVPENNTELTGLYKSNGIWCTQCEATDFRNITWFIDRPDNMASYLVKIIADPSVPVLLSNGNLIAKGVLENGRNYAFWQDPVPKPSYLFALVAGDLDHIEDTFTTMSGRAVQLRIYADAKDTDKLRFAMDSLKRSMRWDEVNYDREYDLDLFNIVAVNDFNAGAMENRSLNIFNTAYVLAHHRTQPDGAFSGVEATIAHEYFHHWTGNNVTLRDWPELTLKEGLTVYRDQCFSADMGSAAINRIKAVQYFRPGQFRQDAGPMAHPIRPDEYESINNIYTSTVYYKGAQVVGMIPTLIGHDAYHRAMDLYFKRYTGKAVACDDFLQCMEDASGYDMAQFKLWYSQAGTPVVHATWEHNDASQKFTLTLAQTVPPTPGQPDKEAMVIPVAFGIVGPDGQDVALDADGKTDQLLILNQATQTFTFDNIPAGSVPSLLRNFSAPVILRAPYTDDQLRHLMVHDSDGFNQWEAGHQLILKEMVAQVERAKAGEPIVVYSKITDALRGMISRPDMDKQLLALMLALPSYSDIAQDSKPIDPEAIRAVEKNFLTAIRKEMEADLLSLYQENNIDEPWKYDRESVGRRALKNIALYYLSADKNVRDPQITEIAVKQYYHADNMSDRLGSLSALLHSDAESPEAVSALEDFYTTFKNDELPIDDWFHMKVYFSGQKAVHTAIEIAQHSDFQNPSPNRVTSVFGGVRSNPEAFHGKDGYAYVARQVIALDSRNPQTAAGFVEALTDFSAYAEPWQGQMKAALMMIASSLPHPSDDVGDKLRKALGDDYPAVAPVGAKPPVPHGP